MDGLVECVPNVSEASDRTVLEAIVEAVDGGAGAWLLDHSADVDHARSVFTLAGTTEAVPEAVAALAGVAIERIDMRRHAGRHPRIGAVDVVPFVPLDGLPMARCVRLAEALGQLLADRFGLPVYLYGQAARRPDRRALAGIRRPGFEGLARALATDDGAPDLGPHRPHPTAGATAVGARSFLIAWNIQLESRDVSVARRIASAIRERDGGLAAVQALGLALDSAGCVQVSMNLLDHERTPMWRAWEAVGRRAAAERVAIRDSELIGLVPLAALEAVADHIGARPPADGRSGVASDAPIEEAAAWLRLRDFSTAKVLEHRLASVRAGG